MTEHPITPPPELVEQWRNSAPVDCVPLSYSYHIAIQSARWGADQELEACVELLSDLGGDGVMVRRYRRPKPLSLKELALALVEQHEDGWRPSPKDWDTIRRALEQLDD